MPNDFIMFTTIYLGTILICNKILNIKIYKISQKIYYLSSSIILSILTTFLSVYFIELYIAPLSFLWIMITILCSQPQIAFVTTIISFCISYSAHALSSLIIITLAYPFSSDIKTLPFVPLVLFTTILHMTFIFLLCRTKRLRKGIPVLSLKSSLNIATYICVFLIGLMTYVPTKESNKQIQLLVLFTFLITLPIIIHWWQAQITKSYRHSLQLRELESLRIELQEKDKLLKEISAKNEQMGHVIHEDTKLLRTLFSGISDYAEADFDNEEARKLKGNALLEVIHSHSDERLGTIRSINNKDRKTYSTSIEALNLQLNHFAKRAASENVTLHIHIACDLEKYIPHVISPSDLSHLISNLLDNAFIAASYAASRMIQLQFYEVNKHFVIEIADSGIPFEIESLINFGLTQLTTHENEGGSGIGLMEIWKVKEKHGATLHIEEYESPSPYSKKISLTFNRKNRFSIRSWRKNDIQCISKRIDLQIYDTTTF